jgi:hypothetical protein
MEGSGLDRAENYAARTEGSRFPLFHDAMGRGIEALCIKAAIFEGGEFLSWNDI